MITYPQRYSGTLITGTLNTGKYIEKIFNGLWQVDGQQIEAVYHDIKSAGVIIPAGEGRSKGALSISCSEMAKMGHGKMVMDRSDIGFPGRDLAEAAPVLRKRYGQICLLINSGSGRSLNPLLDAQKLGYYIANSKDARDFRIDLATTVLDSPLGKLSEKYGNRLLMNGKETSQAVGEPSEFRPFGVIEDIFTLSSGLLFHSMTRAMNVDASAAQVIPLAKNLSTQISTTVNKIVKSQLYEDLLDALEQRGSCFFAGLGSSQEVTRMTGVRVGHVKRAMGDHIYVAGETNTPPPRPGDVLVVVSNSGETEIVAGLCRSFRKMGGQILSIVGTANSTIESLSDAAFLIQNDTEPGVPSNFYIQAAFALSPLPIFLVERVESKGLELPDYIRNWHQSAVA
tara:strand:+ start:660 stop:1853 length:1194 start_codon:yes stop_codon:yes gene_type:complete